MNSFLKSVRSLIRFFDEVGDGKLLRVLLWLSVGGFVWYVYQHRDTYIPALIAELSRNPFAVAFICLALFVMVFLVVVQRMLDEQRSRITAVEAHLEHEQEERVAEREYARKEADALRDQYERALRTIDQLQARVTLLERQLYRAGEVPLSKPGDLHE